MINNESLKNKYNSVYKEGLEKFYSFSSYDESKLILNFIPSWKGKSVFEFGCGKGHLAAMIGFAGAKKVDAVDYSEEAINISKSTINLENVNFSCADALDITEKYDVVVMQGVLEHIDMPFDTLKKIIENNLKQGGALITSSPSFINPRGYVWMTLQLLFDIPMSLSDIHFFCPFDFESFANKYNYKLQMKSSNYDWGSGEGTIIDFDKRLRNALRDAGMDNSKVSDLLKWLRKAMIYFNNDNLTGANVAYMLEK